MSIEKKHTPTPIYLPHDLVENILSRLTMKPLLRFKAVCKQWSATISGLHQTKNSSFSSFLYPSFDGLTRIALENRKFRELSPIQYPPPLMTSFSCAWSHCNGLFLVSFKDFEVRGTDYVLWNPSQGTYKELHYPYPCDYNSRPFLHGIYYNPLAKDYRVLIIHADHYAVYSCKNKSWSEMRTNEISIRNFHSSYNRCAGVPHNESIYWLMHSNVIVYFDGRDEKLKIFCNLDIANINYVGLFSSRDSLYLIPYGLSEADRTKEEMVITKILPICMEIKAKFPRFCCVMSTLSPCFTQENKIFFWGISRWQGYLLYDFTEGCFSGIETSRYTRCDYLRLFPYIENSFLL